MQAFVRQPLTEKLRELEGGAQHGIEGRKRWFVRSLGEESEASSEYTASSVRAQATQFSHEEWAVPERALSREGFVDGPDNASHSSWVSAETVRDLENNTDVGNIGSHGL